MYTTWKVENAQLPLVLVAKSSCKKMGGKAPKTKSPFRTWEVANAIRVFPKIGVPQNGWFIMANPIFLMDDLGGKPTIFGNIHLLSPYKWRQGGESISRDVRCQKPRATNTTAGHAFHGKFPGCFIKGSENVEHTWG